MRERRYTVLIVGYLAVMLMFTIISKERERGRTPVVRVTSLLVKEIDTGAGAVPYFGCVPAGALYRDIQGYYVFVAEPQDTILGERMEARAVSVRVEVQDENWAALEKGSIGNHQQIIFEADREVREGYPVNILEEK